MTIYNNVRNYWLIDALGPKQNVMDIHYIERMRHKLGGYLPIYLTLVLFKM